MKSCVALVAACYHPAALEPATASEASIDSTGDSVAADADVDVDASATSSCGGKVWLLFPSDDPLTQDEDHNGVLDWGLGAGVFSPTDLANGTWAPAARGMLRTSIDGPLRPNTLRVHAKLLTEAGAAIDDGTTITLFVAAGASTNVQLELSLKHSAAAGVFDLTEVSGFGTRTVIFGQANFVEGIFHVVDVEIDQAQVQPMVTFSIDHGAETTKQLVTDQKAEATRVEVDATTHTQVRDVTVDDCP